MYENKSAMKLYYMVSHILEIENRLLWGVEPLTHSKGPFINYVVTISAFFDPLPLLDLSGILLSKISN